MSKGPKLRFHGCNVQPYDSEKALLFDFQESG
jgi:hypothetical protein